MSHSSGQDLFKEGIAQFKSGNHQEAADLFLEIIRQDEENHKAWNALGVIHTTAGRFQEADECYEKALSLAPGTKPYIRNQERNRASMGVQEEAPAEDAEAADTLLKRAQVLRDMESLEEALSAFEQAIRLHPKNARAWHEMGQVLYELGRYEEAVATFDKAIQLDPGNFIIYENKAQVLWYELNRGKESVETYDLAIQKLNEVNEGLYATGLSYDGLRDVDVRDESVNRFEQVSTNLRLCYSMLQSKGEGLFSLGRYEEAVETFDQVIRLNKEFAWASYSQGAILSILPKADEGPEEAIKVFNNAHEGFRLGEKTYYLKGLALGKLGKFDEAIAAINQAIRLDPKYADAIQKG